MHGSANCALHPVDEDSSLRSHNGKLDYPARVLGYMQDPELHGLIYGGRQPNPDITV